MASCFKLHIYAADHAQFDGECVSLTVTLPDGELGLLAFHRSVAAALVPGRLVYRLVDGTEVAAVAGHGLLRFAGNDALVLLDSVEPTGEIDVPRARAAAENARRALGENCTPQQRLQAEYDLLRANARLKAAGETAAE